MLHVLTAQKAEGQQRLLLHPGEVHERRPALVAGQVDLLRSRHPNRCR